MELKPGVTFVATSAIDEVAKELAARDIKTYVLNPRAEPDGVYEEMRRALPLDPPVQSKEPNWDAMDGSVYGGLCLVDSDDIAILWPDASRSQARDQRDYESAIEVLEDLVSELADPEVTGDPKTVYIYVGRD